MNRSEVKDLKSKIQSLRSKVKEPRLRIQRHMSKAKDAKPIKSQEYKAKDSFTEELLHRGLDPFTEDLTLSQKT